MGPRPGTGRDVRKQGSIPYSLFWVASVFGCVCVCERERERERELEGAFPLYDYYVFFQWATLPELCCRFPTVLRHGQDH